MASKEILGEKLAMENLGLKGTIGGKDVLIARLRQLVRKLRKNIRNIEKERDEFKRLATTDHLTAIPNRRRFEEMAFEILLAHLNGSRKADHPEKYLAFTLIDVYRFKEINDILGYDQGDAVLKDLAESIQHCVRKEDAFGRLGGDEFAIFFESERGDDEALFSFAQRISHYLLKKIESKFGENQSIGISVGIFLMEKTDQIVWKMRETYTQLRQKGESACYDYYLSPTSLLDYLKRNAELLMKKAKSEGKNRVCIGRYLGKTRQQQTNEQEGKETAPVDTMHIFEKDL